MSNNNVYESIMAGLNEALADAQSEKPILKRHKVIVEPVKVFDADEVRKIRNSTGMSQKIFASYMGVSHHPYTLGTAFLFCFSPPYNGCNLKECKDYIPCF